jgi:hypothetical protein
MKRTIRFVLLLLSTCNIIHVAFAQKAKKYFEGTVKYQIEYLPYDASVSRDSLSEVFGETMEFTIKDGFTKKCFYNKDGKIIETDIFDPKNNLSSIFFDGIDTLYQFHENDTSLNAIEYIHLKDTVIDGINLEGIRVAVVDKKNKRSESKTFWRKPITFSYYFDKSLAVDPHNFSKFYECEWYRIINEKKSIATYMVVDNGSSFFTKKKSTAVNSGTINSNVFKIKRNLIIKNLD